MEAGVEQTPVQNPYKIQNPNDDSGGDYDVNGTFDAMM